MYTTVDRTQAQTVLVRLQSTVRARRAAEVADLELVLEWCDIHSADPRDNADKLPGERSVADPVRGGPRLEVLGGEGTPGVRDTSLCELSIAREVHPHSTRATVADALDLRHRLPRTWERVRALDGETWVARRVARMTRRLSELVVHVVDDAVAEAIAGQSPGRVLEIAEAKVIEADPAGHELRVQAERKKRYFALGRVDEHGLRLVMSRVTAGDAYWIEQTVQRVADILATDPAHAETSADELRSIAMGWLARPVDLLTLLLANPDAEEVELVEEPEVDAPEVELVETPEPDRRDHPEASTVSARDLLSALRALDPQRLKPRTVLYVHLHEAALQGVPGVGRVEGIGPVSMTQLRELLAGGDVVVKPVVDVNEHRAVNGYEHPEDIKEKIHLLRPGDGFPHGTTMGRHLDLDHAVPYQPTGPPGQTSTKTSQPLSRTGHRAKTHEGYRCWPLETGEMLWRTPHGMLRLVDATGTRKIDAGEAASWLGTASDPTTDPALDRALTRIWHRLLTGQAI